MQNATTVQILLELEDLLGCADLCSNAQKRTTVSCNGLFVQLALLDGGRLRLSSWVGNFPQDTQQLTVARLLLAANHFFALTGGATLAVEPMSHQIWLHQDLPLDGTNAHSLFVGMEHFVDAAASWFDRLHETEDAETSSFPLIGRVHP